MITNGVASEYEMRDATPEERKAVSDYIDSISVATGFNIYDLQEQVKIYDAYYNRGFSNGEKKGKILAIEECIKALEEYKQEPMTDPYEIDECIDVLNKIKH